MFSIKSISYFVADWIWNRCQYAVYSKKSFIMNTVQRFRIWILLTLWKNTFRVLWFCSFGNSPRSTHSRYSTTPFGFVWRWSFLFWYFLCYFWWFHLWLSWFWSMWLFATSTSTENSSLIFLNIVFLLILSKLNVD